MDLEKRIRRFQTGQSANAAFKGIKLPNWASRNRKNFAGIHEYKQRQSFQES